MIKRLFIGVPVSEDVKGKVKPLLDKLNETGADLSLVQLNNLHFTIKFLGDVDESKVDEIKGKLFELVSAQKSFPISLEKVGVFPSLDMIKVVWIGVRDSELTLLMKKTNQVLNYIRENEHEEVPHLTIARVRSARNKLQLKEFLLKVKDELFGEMIVDKLVLYESVLTAEGPVYKELEVFGLG